MAYNGSGTFLINTAGQPVVAGTVISSTTFNSLTADLATGLSTVITKDGQTTVTANIPMASFKFTGLGVGSAAGDSANLSQVQSTVTKLLTSVSGTDTITAVGAPVVAAYAAGQMFYFVATGDNTTSVTINIDGLGAKAVTRDGSVALVAGDIKSGEVVVVVYDGTRFQVVSQLNSAGNATFANVSITSALNVGGVATFSAGTAAAPSITTTGDTNTGIFFPAADTIGFTEGGAEAMRVDSGGNLLIGQATNTQNYKLVIKGSAGTADDFAFNSDATRSEIQSFNSKPLELNRQGNNVLIGSAGSGNLGIGTTSPGQKLDVRGNGSFTSSAASSNVFLGSAAGNDGSTVRFLGSNTQKNWLIGNQFNVSGALEFTPSTTTGGSTFTTPSMVIDSSGNLGLGVTPSAFAGAGKIIQFGNGNASIGTQNSGDANFMHNAYESPTGTFKYVGSGIGALRYQLDINNNVHKWYYAASGTANNTISFTQAMTLSAAGGLTVGGTTDPGAGRILAEGSGTSHYVASSKGGVTSTYLITDASGANVQVDGAWPIRFTTNSTERARITSAGEFLVGTTSAFSGSGISPKVTISNTAGLGLIAIGSADAGLVTQPAGNTNYYAGFFLNSSSTGIGNISCTSSATAYNTSSDYRLKNTIAPMTGALAKVALLKPVTYKWNADGSDGQGFIAHELAEVVPDCVTGEKDAVDVEGNPRYQGVDTSFLVATLTAAIQELTARVAQLESK